MEKFKESQNEVEVVLVNVDEDSDVAQKYGVRNIPTILYLEDGVEKQRSIGITDVKKLTEMSRISE